MTLLKSTNNPYYQQDAKKASALSDIQFLEELPNSGSTHCGVLASRLGNGISKFIMITKLLFG